MNALILNRDFTHPTDGWYQIEAKGNHPNRAAGVVQVIDDEATQSIVNRFNSEAAAKTLRHGSEMLIDHEHFSDQPDKESRAYGWLTQLQNRDDGIYGQIRWTKTGKEAVDGGDYRFFSTEYAADDLKVLNDGKPRSVRPLRLDGLSLTNMNNNRGQKPITNRTSQSATMCPECNVKLIKNAQGKMECPECGKNYAGVSASADTTETNQKTKNRMKTVCSLLGLSADADETSVHAAVSKIINRGDITPDALVTLRAEHKSFGELNQTLLGEQVDALMDAHGIKADDKVRNRLKPSLIPMKNREERLAALADFGFKPVEAVKQTETVQQRQLRNRDTNQPDKSKVEGLDEKELAQKAEAEVQDYKIRNRCSYGEARNAVRSAKPELFGIK